MGVNSYPDTPEEAKSEQDILAMVSEFHRDSTEYHSDWLKNAEEDFKFYEGDQWDTEVKKQLEAEGKVALTKNFVFSLINLLVGIQMDGRLQMKAIPRSKEDNPVAEAMSELLKFIWYQNRADRELSELFKNGGICGRGWFNVEQIDDEQDIFNTQTKLENLFYPQEVIYDRKSRKYDLSDCDYIIREKLISRSEALTLWADKKDELSKYFSFVDSKLVSMRDLNQSSIYRQLISILGYWYRVYDKERYLLDSLSGQIYQVSQDELGSLMYVIRDNQHLKLINKHRKRMKYAYTIGTNNGVLLEHGDSPYEDNFYPIIPYFAYRGMNLDFGVVKNVKDPQREVNKRDSQLLHILNQSVKQGIITDDPELADEFEREGNKNSFVIVAKKGSQWTMTQQPQFPVAHANLVEKNKSDMKLISGINDELRGIRAGQDSGVVVDIRRQQSMAIISSLFDNLERTTELIANTMMSRIRQYMTPEQMTRILGEKADPQIIQALKEKSVSEYDIAIEKSGASPTMRIENFNKIMELVKNFGPGLIPPDVVIEVADPPHKEEILARLQQQQQPQQPTGVSPEQIPAGAPTPPPMM